MFTILGNQPCSCNAATNLLEERIVAALPQVWRFLADCSAFGHSASYSVKSKYLFCAMRGCIGYRDSVREPTPPLTPPNFSMQHSWGRPRTSPSRFFCSPSCRFHISFAMICYRGATSRRAIDWRYVVWELLTESSPQLHRCRSRG